MSSTPSRSVLKAGLFLTVMLATGPLAATGATNPQAPAAKPMDLFADDIVARGEGVKVTRAALDEALITIKASAAARGQQIPPQAMRSLEAQVLSRLVGMQLLNQTATEADKTAGAENAKKQLEAMRTATGSDENFSRQLRTVGMTLDELSKKMTEEATADVILRRVLKFEVTDAEVKKFYDENPGKFEKPDEVRAAHILIGTRDSAGAEMTAEKKKEQLALAEKVLKRARDGEDFGKLAAEYSEDPGSKDSGGEYTFPRGKMVPEFEAVAFSQGTNQISDIVTTQFGYHIIKTLEKLPARKIPLAEASDDVRKFLENRGLQEQVPVYMEKLEKSAKVEILDAELRSVIEQARAAAKTGAAEPPASPR
jgi:peptidyl-prolyl cis-trans isomerase C